MRKRTEYVLFLAESFGFGPISSSIAVARALGKIAPSKRCIFCGSGTSLHLARESCVFHTVHYAKIFSSESLAELTPDISPQNCIVVANTSPTGVAAAKRAGFRCLFIDTLFWMWSKLPIDLDDVAEYFIEDFPCVDFSIDRFGASRKFSLIPPLIDVSVPSRPVDHPFIVVSLGGIDTGRYDFPVFYDRLIQHISNDEKLRTYNIMICGGGAKIRGGEFSHLQHSRLKITCLSPQDHIAYLRSADIVLASAGLHGFFENLFLQKNVFFLPPQTYSQYYQLKYVMEHYKGVVGANYEQLGITHCLRPGMPDIGLIYEVKRVAQALAQDEVFHAFLRQLNSFLKGYIKTSWSSPTPDTIVRTNGPSILAESILLHSSSMTTQE